MSESKSKIPPVFREEIFPGGKLHILGGHSIGHSKQRRKRNVYKYIYPIPNGFRDRVISLYSSKTVDTQEILRTVSNTVIYCSSDKVSTVFIV
jgi:hypothetical protein